MKILPFSDLRAGDEIELAGDDDFFAYGFVSKSGDAPVVTWHRQSKGGSEEVETVQLMGMCGEHLLAPFTAGQLSFEEESDLVYLILNVSTYPKFHGTPIIRSCTVERGGKEIVKFE